MCGFVAVASTDPNSRFPECQSALDLLKQRGPDESGHDELNGCWLGSRRLSICDAAHGQQPFRFGHLSIVFNGEIYNHKELRKVLNSSGYRFITSSDTEVLIKAFDAWGPEFVARIDGMFAFAIWNDIDRQLFVARDRLGEKPLYYNVSGAEIAVASELKALMKIGSHKPEISTTALENYLKCMYVQPSKSIYSNIFQLPPGHVGLFKKGCFVIRKYWNVADCRGESDDEEDVGRFEEELTHAITSCSSAGDEEVGVLISGGIDSSIVAIKLAEYVDKPIKTFSVKYSGSFDESEFAKQVVKKIGSLHTTVEIPGLDFDELDQIIQYMDEPHADSSDFPQHLLCKEAARSVKAVCGGDGADELFYGYRWYDSSMFDDRLTLSHVANRVNSVCVFDSDMREQLMGGFQAIENNLSEEIEAIYGANSLKGVSYFDLNHHLPGQILAKVDRASMMHGLEVRSPFLRRSIVEMAFSLPIEEKLRRGSNKWILRKILSKYMGTDFAERKKQGFGAPIDEWLRAPQSRDRVWSTLDKSAALGNWLDIDLVRQHVLEFYDEKSSHWRAGQRVWVLYCLERWLSLGPVGGIK
jgi:asparagine synthase (glutamine-hydrolysing)